MNRYPTQYTPTLLSTVAEIWDVSRAIWCDYRDCARQARRRAHHDRRHALQTVRPAWHNDVLFLAVVALTLVCASLTIADGWDAAIALLVRLGGLL